MMIIHDGMKASAAAMRVGYESASQFSREFKRYFGVTPGKMRQECGRCRGLNTFPVQQPGTGKSSGVTVFF